MRDLGRLLLRVDRPHPYRAVSWIFLVPALCGVGVVVMTGDWFVAAFPAAMIAVAVWWRWMYRGMTLTLHEQGFRYEDRDIDQTIRWRDVTRYRVRRLTEGHVLTIHLVAGKPYELHGELVSNQVVDAIVRRLDDNVAAVAR